MIQDFSIDIKDISHKEKISREESLELFKKKVFQQKDQKSGNLLI